MVKKRLFTLEPRGMVITIAQKPVSPLRLDTIALVLPTNCRLSIGPVRISGLVLEAPRHLALRVESVRDE